MHLTVLARLGETGIWPAGDLARLCQDVIAHGALINQVNSEPDLGSPSRGGLPGTTAERTPHGWVINGHKRWASLAPALSYMFAMAAVVDGDMPPQRGNFLVPASSPGVRVEQTWDNLGMRGTASDDVDLHECRGPARCPRPHAEGSDDPGDGIGWSPLGYAAVSLGIAQAARDAAVAYARERRPIGMAGPIAELQTIQHRIAGIELELLKARALLYATAEWWLANPAQRERPDLAAGGGEADRHQRRHLRHRPGAARQRLRRVGRLLAAAALFPRRPHLARPAANRRHCADRNRQGRVGIAVAAFRASSWC